MAIGGAFLGGGVEVVPAGYCKLSIQIMTDTRADLNGTVTVTGGSNTYTATAGTDGRAELNVASGVTYTASVNVTGFNADPQIVIAESATVKYVRFDINKASYGTDLKPVKIVNGVPTAVANDLVTTGNVAQSIDGYKTYIKPIIGIATRHVTIASGSGRRYVKVATMTSPVNWTQQVVRLGISFYVNVSPSKLRESVLVLAFSTNGSAQIQGVSAYFETLMDNPALIGIKVFWDASKVEIWADFGNENQHNYFDVELLSAYNRSTGVDVNGMLNTSIVLEDSPASALPTGMTETVLNVPWVYPPELTANGYEVINAAWIRSTTVDANGYSQNGLVHNTGNEKIAGTKTFVHTPYLVSAGLVLQTAYTSAQSSTGSYINMGTISMFGSDNSIVGQWRVDHDTYNSRRQYLYMTRIIDGVTYENRFAQIIDAQKNIFTTTGWRATPGGANEILTMGNGVTLTTPQIITGQKTFKAWYLTLQNDGIPENAQPNATAQRTINFTDIAGNPRASIWAGSRSDDNHLLVRVYKTPTSWTDMGMRYILSEDRYQFSGPTPPTNSNTTEVATTEWIRSTSVDSYGYSLNGLVHGSGAETISGTKTFVSSPIVKMSLPQLYLKHSSDDYTQATSAVDTRYFLGFQDKNGADTFHLSEYVYNGGRAMSISQQNKVGGTTVRNCNLTLYAPASSGGYATCTYRETPATNGELLVFGNGVTLKTAQTISGQKTFDSGSATTNILVNTSQYGYITFKNSGYTKGESSNSGECALRFNDSANSTTGWLANSHSTAFDSVTTLSAYGKNTSDNSAVDARIVIRAIHDGTMYATSPARTYNSSNTSDIVTIGMMSSTSVDANGFSVNGLVHNSGNEKIGGNKTLTGITTCYGTTTDSKFNLQGNYDATSTSLSGIFNTMKFVDSNNYMHAQISAYAHATSITDTRELRFFINDHENAYSMMSLVKEYNKSTQIKYEGLIVPSPPATWTAVRNIKISNTDPTSSDGKEGDIWIKY